MGGTLQLGKYKRRKIPKEIVEAHKVSEKCFLSKFFQVGWKSRVPLVIQPKITHFQWIQ